MSERDRAGLRPRGLAGLLAPRRLGAWTVVVALAVMTCAAACGPRARPAQTPAPRPRGTLHPPEHYAVSFTIDQEVTAVHAAGSETFRAVIEKRGERLVMVGLGPHGGRAFTLLQEGEQVSFESQLPRELPFPPEYMLMDIHRTWLRGLPREGDAPLPDGEHEGDVEGERVRERWLGGRLLERHFTAPQGDAPWWTVDITYEGGLGDGSLPSRVVFDETPAPEQHYRLVLDNLSGELTSGEGATR